MEKVDLSDITFLIPIRLDSVIRIENLLCSIQFLCSNFKTKIFVLEGAPYNNGFLQKMLPVEVDYMFVEDHDDIFYRTHYLNVLIRQSKTPYIGIWDADVLLKPAQLVAAVEALRSSNYQVAFPYNGYFYDTTFIIRELFMMENDFECLRKNQDKMLLLYGPMANGGAIFVNREFYIEAGAENEAYYGWAPEDVERIERLKKMGAMIFRAKEPLYHLSHPRNINSTYRSEYYKKYSLALLENIRFSSEREIKQQNIKLH